MPLLSIKINFFKTIKILNIFQYILTHLIISNQIQYNNKTTITTTKEKVISSPAYGRSKLPIDTAILERLTNF